MVSSLVFNLEDNLPDELVSNSNWNDALGGNNPTAQVNVPPGQLNGEDPGGMPAMVQRQIQHQQQLQHMLQQQVTIESPFFLPFVISF